LFFNGAYSKEGIGLGVFLIPPIGQSISLSFKLELDATNNVIEYEALILGLEIA